MFIGTPRTMPLPLRNRPCFLSAGEIPRADMEFCPRAVLGDDHGSVLDTFWSEPRRSTVEKSYCRRCGAGMSCQLDAPLVEPVVSTRWTMGRPMRLDVVAYDRNPSFLERRAHRYAGDEDGCVDEGDFASSAHSRIIRWPAGCRPECS